MTRTLLAFLLGTLLTTPALSADAPETISLPRNVLTNDGLAVLAKAGLGDNLLVDLVRHKRTHFDTSAEALAALARYGISEAVIRAVVEKQEQVLLRKPRLTLSPASPGGQAGGTMEVGAGDLVLLPAPTARKNIGEADRWYKVSVQ